MTRTPRRRRWMPIIHAPAGASALAPTERKIPGPAGRKLERPSPLALDGGCKFSDSNREGRWLFCLCGGPLGTTVQSAGQLPARVQHSPAASLAGWRPRARGGSPAIQVRLATGSSAKVDTPESAGPGLYPLTSSSKPLPWPLQALEVQSCHGQPCILLKAE